MSARGVDIFCPPGSSVKRAFFSSWYEKNARRPRNSLPGYPKYPGCLLAVDTDHTDFGILLIPVRGHVVENQAKVALLPWFDWSGGNRPYIDVGLSGADKTQGHSQSLSILPNVAVEADLNRDCGESAIARVLDLAVDIRDFSPGKAVCFAHLQAADRQAGSIGVGRSHASAGGWRVRVDTIADHDPEPKTHDDHGCGDDPR